MAPSSASNAITHTNLNNGQTFYISPIIYVLVQNLAKLSIVCFYLRIFIETRFRLLTKTALAALLCHAL